MPRIGEEKTAYIDLWPVTPQSVSRVSFPFGWKNHMRNQFSLIRTISRESSATGVDHADFAELAIPLLNSSHNFARWLVGNDHDAEDLVQETYLKAFSNFRSFQPGTNFRAWMFRILRNTFLNSRSSLDSQLTVELNDEEPDLVGSERKSPESLLIQKMSADLILDAIERLPSASREVILLCDVEEFAYREIAQILGVPIGTVMSRITRARRALRRALVRADLGRRRVSDKQNGYSFAADRMVANG